MEYIKKGILRGLIGICIGVFINQIGYIIIALTKETITLSSQIVISQFIISGLTGFYCTASSIIFDIEEWSRLRQTVTHFIVLLPYFPVAIYAGWMPSTTTGIMFFIINYICVYLLIWFSFKSYWKKKAKKLNYELEIIKKRFNNEI